MRSKLCNIHDLAAKRLVLSIIEGDKDFPSKNLYSNLRSSYCIKLQAVFCTGYTLPMRSSYRRAFLKKFKELAEKRGTKFKIFKSRITQQHMHVARHAIARFDATGMVHLAKQTVFQNIDW